MNPAVPVPDALKARRLSEELARLQDLFAERSVRVDEVIAALGGRAYLLLVILLALPFCTPFSLPGLSTPFGLIIALIGARLALRQKPWLPRRLLATRLPPNFFVKLFGVTRRIVRGFEHFLKPRLPFLTGAPALAQIHALAIALAGALLLLPLPIPFTNTLPAWAILLLAGGLLERDGLFILLGYVVFVLGGLYFMLLGHATGQMFQVLRHWLFNP